ncbi:hypothetical protein ACFIOY_36705 [Bradyrhizobium sp. TZ2]
MAILKVLVSYPDGFAALADLKRDVAILATSGQEWSERTTRLAARVPSLEIFAQGLVELQDGGWRITDAGRSALDLMKRKPAAPPPAQIATPEPSPAIPLPQALLPDQTAAASVGDGVAGGGPDNAGRPTPPRRTWSRSMGSLGALFGP